MEPGNLALLIGVLVICEGEIWAGNADQVAVHMLRRWQSQAVLPAAATTRDVRQVLADLNQHVRYAKREYEEPPVSSPVAD